MTTVDKSVLEGKTKGLALIATPHLRPFGSQDEVYAKKIINPNPPPASKAAMAAPVVRPMRLAAWGRRYNAFRAQNDNACQLVP
jgi:hypothetical protein